MKYVAIAVSLDELSDATPFVIVDQNSKMKLFNTEEEAIKFIKKEYVDSIQLIGMIDDPRPIYKILKKEYLK